MGFHLTNNMIFFFEAAHLTRSKMSPFTCTGIIVDIQSHTIKPKKIYILVQVYACRFLWVP